MSATMRVLVFDFDVALESQDCFKEGKTVHEHNDVSWQL